MEAQVTKDAQVLIPNPTHKNFTRSNEAILAGTKISGEIKQIQGLKRGKIFVYNLFYTDDNKIIYIKNIKPINMEKTEVTLGADSAQSPTKVDLPTNSNLGKRPIIGALVGAAAGFGIAKYRKVEGNKKVIYVVIGGLIGFAIGKYFQSHTKVVIKPSK